MTEIESNFLYAFGIFIIASLVLPIVIVALKQTSWWKNQRKAKKAKLKTLALGIWSFLVFIPGTLYTIFTLHNELAFIVISPALIVTFILTKTMYPQKLFLD